MGVDVFIAVLGTIGVGLATLVFHALRDIKKTTKGNETHLNKVVVQVTEINGSVKRNADRLADHIKTDDDRVVRRDAEYARTQTVLGQIWGEVKK